jgi:hypothetical protein
MWVYTRGYKFRPQRGISNLPWNRDKGAPNHAFGLYQQIVKEPGFYSLRSFRMKNWSCTTYRKTGPQIWPTNCTSAMTQQFHLKWFPWQLASAKWMLSKRQHCYKLHGNKWLRIVCNETRHREWTSGIRQHREKDFIKHLNGFIQQEHEGASLHIEHKT